MHLRAKNGHYSVDGRGRDTYIFNINGGFYPEKHTSGVEQLGMSFNFNINQDPLSPRSRDLANNQRISIQSLWDTPTTAEAETPTFPKTQEV